MVVRGHVQSGHTHQRRRQQRLLEGGVEAHELRAFVLRLLPGAQQFGLVGAPVAGVEDGGADHHRLSVAAGLDRGGDQHGQTAAVGRLEFQGDPADLALHAQQRAEVGLVVDAAPTVSRSENVLRPTRSPRARPSHCSRVALIFAIVPSGSVERKPHGACSYRSSTLSSSSAEDAARSSPGRSSGDGGPPLAPLPVPPVIVPLRRGGWARQPFPPVRRPGGGGRSCPG